MARLFYYLPKFQILCDRLLWLLRNLILTIAGAVVLVGLRGCGALSHDFRYPICTISTPIMAQLPGVRHEAFKLWGPGVRLEAPGVRRMMPGIPDINNNCGSGKIPCQ